MPDKITGHLQIGTNNNFEVVVNHPDGVGYIVFSVDQARTFANKLLRQAAIAERDREEECKRIADLKFDMTTPSSPPPVDRTQRILTNGLPETPDHREINPVTGQQKEYIVLSPTERSKGFVRPVRRSYTHVGKLVDQEFENTEHPSGVTQTWKEKMRVGGCRTDTTMSESIAETYARDPGFYSGTFCCACRKHLPLEEFVWKGTQETVGS